MIRIFDEMITLFWFFAVPLQRKKSSIMAKTIYQESAMEYAKAYLERLLDLEDLVGQRVEEKLRSMVQDEVKKYIKQ